MANSFLVIIPTCTFLGHFGGTSVHFGRAMVCLFRRRYQTKIPMARTNKSDMPQKRTKNGTIRYLPYPSFGQVTMISNWLIIFVRYSNHWYSMLRSIILTRIFQNWEEKRKPWPCVEFWLRLKEPMKTCFQLSVFFSLSPQHFTKIHALGKWRN